MITERTTWTPTLRHVPSWALREELERRGEEPTSDQSIRLPGLVIDLVAGLVDWRGAAYPVGGRAMDVLVGIARAHLEGRRRIRSDVLAARVHPGWDLPTARSSIWSYTSRLRRRIPGLVVTDRFGGRAGGFKGYYRLAIDEETAR